MFYVNQVNLLDSHAIPFFFKHCSGADLSLDVAIVETSWDKAQRHITAHTICVVMATALCYKNYQLIQRTLQLEREVSGTELEQLSSLCTLLQVDQPKAKGTTTVQ